VNPLPFMKAPPLHLEFTRHSLIAGMETDGAEFPLERQPDGRLTVAARERTVAALKQFLKARGWPAHGRAWCAIDARGVSLRCLSLPVVAGDGWHRLVRLQIESEFPLPPEELAWGFRLLGEPQRQPDGALKQSVLVAAVKKEIVGEYADLLTAAGVTAGFTVAALARAELCPHRPAAYAVLELGSDQSELAGFEDHARAFVRVLPVGTRTSGTSGQSGETALESLAKVIRSQCRVSKLYIFGDADMAAQLARRLGDAPVGEPVKISPGAGRSAAILGLKKLAEDPGGGPLTLQLKPAADPKIVTSPVLVEWGVRALLLLLAVLLFPFLEALFLTAPLSTKVAAFQTRAGLLETNVDRDLDFLQYLKQNQPPYLGSYYIIAQAAPSGIHIDSLTLNRRGEMSLRGSLRNGDQVADFRSKLMASGCFAAVTVEDQSPTPDHQKVNIRMTAQLKPLGQLLALPIGPSPAAAGGDTNPPDASPGKPPAAGLSANKDAVRVGAHSSLSTNLIKGGTN